MLSLENTRVSSRPGLHLPRAIAVAVLFAVLPVTLASCGSQQEPQAQVKFPIEDFSELVTQWGRTWRGTKSLKKALEAVLEDDRFPQDVRNLAQQQWVETQRDHSGALGAFAGAIQSLQAAITAQSSESGELAQELKNRADELQKVADSVWERYAGLSKAFDGKPQSTHGLVFLVPAQGLKPDAESEILVAKTLDVSVPFSVKDIADAVATIWQKAEDVRRKRREEFRKELDGLKADLTKMLDEIKMPEWDQL